MARIRLSPGFGSLQAINHSAALAVLVQNMGALLVIICLVPVLHSPRYTAILHFKRLQILANSGKIPTKDRDSSKLRQMLLTCAVTFVDSVGPFRFGRPRFYPLIMVHYSRFLRKGYPEQLVGRSNPHTSP